MARKTYCKKQTHIFLCQLLLCLLVFIPYPRMRQLAVRVMITSYFPHQIVTTNNLSMKYTKVVLPPVLRQQINKIGLVIKMRSVIFFLFIHHTIVVRITMLLTLSCCSHLVLHTPSHCFLHLSTSSLRLCTYRIFNLSMHRLRKANCLIVVNRLKIFVVHLLNQINMMLLHLIVTITLFNIY